MSTLLISTDLMTSSQIQTGATCAPAAAIDQIASDPPSLVVIDLTANGVDIAAIVAAMDGRPVIAFGPHVHEQKLRAAQDAGCTQVFTRGAFFRSAAEILQRYSDQST